MQRISSTMGGIGLVILFCIPLSATPSCADAFSTKTNKPVLSKKQFQLLPEDELKQNPDVTIIIKFKLSRDGMIEGTPTVLGQGRNPDAVSKAKENALTAVLRSQPFALPQEKYEDWKNVELKFSAH